MANLPNGWLIEAFEYKLIQLKYTVISPFPSLLSKISSWLSMNLKADNFLTDLDAFCGFLFDSGEAPFSWVCARLGARALGSCFLKAIAGTFVEQILSPFLISPTT